MNIENLLSNLEEKNIHLPDNIQAVLKCCKNLLIFNTTEELADASTNGKDNSEFLVTYDIPEKGEVTEVVVHRVKNGISANYTDPYMRRRDPGTMSIADNLPSDKKRFSEKYGYDFFTLEQETYEWLKKQKLACFFYFAGRENIGSTGIAIAPANAAFFAMGLSMLQQIIPVTDLEPESEIKSVIFVAPVFRHTHFDGK